MRGYVNQNGLSVAVALADFIESDLLPGTGVSADRFWAGLTRIVADLGPRNRAALALRQEMQAQIDAWHVLRRGRPHDPLAYRLMLEKIGYILPEGPDFQIETENTDPEIARVPGPQLVVPVMNARYALNAANARWGSLYDAFYGTDALGDLPKPGGYDPVRGERVVHRVRTFLDETIPLRKAKWRQVRGLRVDDGKLVVALADGDTQLAKAQQFIGYDGGRIRARTCRFQTSRAFRRNPDRRKPCDRSDRSGPYQ